MTSRILLRELAHWLEQVTRGYAFPAPEGGERDARVYLHALPDGQPGTEESPSYPFVVVRWMEGTVQSESDAKTVLKDTVGLALGVHSPRSQEEAGLCLAELVDLLRRELWTLRLLAGRFELEEPIRASIPEPKRKWNQFHLATIETVWNYTWPPRAWAELSPLLGGNTQEKS